MKLRYYQELSEGCLRIDAVTVRRLATRGELTAYRIAGEYRFTPADVESFVESQRIKVGMAPGPDHPLAKFTKRAKKVMSLASEETSHYHQDGIGTEHLLLGLLREEEGLANQVLSSAGVTLEKTRELVKQLLAKK